MSSVPSRRMIRWLVTAALASPAVLVFPPARLPLLTFDLVLLVAAILDWVVTPRPAVLEVTRTAALRMSVLVAQPIALLVRNRSPVVLRVRVCDSAPAGFRAEPQVSGTVAPRGEATLTYDVTPTTRGRVDWGPIHVAYRSLLGLWERRRVIAALGQSHVYPDLKDLHRYHILARADRLDALGLRPVRVRGAAWEFDSLREYVPGDDVRMIDWKATARRAKPIFRMHRAERNQSIVLLVDSGRLMNAELDGIPKLDHAIGSILVLAHIALGRGDAVGLCTFSHRVHTWVAPRAHVAQIRPITDALYDLRGDFTETDHGRCLRHLASCHRKRSLVVVLTDFVDSQAASDMLAHLQMASRRHLLLFVAVGDPFVARAAHSRTERVFDGFRKAVATELLHERREVLERIRKMGAQVLDAEPSELTAPLLNGYLQIAFRGLI